MRPKWLYILQEPRQRFHKNSSIDKYYKKKYRTRGSTVKSNEKKHKTVIQGRYLLLFLLIAKFKLEPIIYSAKMKQNPFFIGRLSCSKDNDWLIYTSSPCTAWCPGDHSTMAPICLNKVKQDSFNNINFNDYKQFVVGWKVLLTSNFITVTITRKRKWVQQTKNDENRKH